MPPLSAQKLINRERDQTLPMVFSRARGWISACDNTVFDKTRDDDDRLGVVGPQRPGDAKADALRPASDESDARRHRKPKAKSAL